MIILVITIVYVNVTQVTEPDYYISPHYFQTFLDRGKLKGKIPHVGQILTKKWSYIPPRKKSSSYRCLAFPKFKYEKGFDPHNLKGYIQQEKWYPLPKFYLKSSNSE